MFVYICIYIYYYTDQRLSLVFISLCQTFKFPDLFNPPVGKLLMPWQHGRIKTLSAMQRCQISWLLSMQHHFIELHPVSAPRKTLSPSVGSKQLPFRTTAATTTKFTQQSITVAGAVLTKTKSEWAN